MKSAAGGCSVTPAAGRCRRHERHTSLVCDEVEGKWKNNRRVMAPGGRLRCSTEGDGTGRGRGREPGIRYPAVAGGVCSAVNAATGSL